MEILKTEAANAIARLPESANIDDIMYELYVIDKVKKGQEAAKRGETISIEDIKIEPPAFPSCAGGTPALLFESQAGDPCHADQAKWASHAGIDGWPGPKCFRKTSGSDSLWFTMAIPRRAASWLTKNSSELRWP